MSKRRDLYKMASTACLCLALFGLILLAVRFLRETITYDLWFLSAVTTINLLFLTSPRRGTTRLPQYFRFLEMWRLFVMLCNLAVLPALAVWAENEPAGILFLWLPYGPIFFLAWRSRWVYRDMRTDVLREYKLERNINDDQINPQEIELRTKISLTHEWRELAEKLTHHTIGEGGTWVFTIAVVGAVLFFGEHKLFQPMALPFLALAAAIVVVGLCARRYVLNFHLRMVLEMFGIDEARIREILRLPRLKTRYFQVQNSLLAYQALHAVEIAQMEQLYEAILVARGFLPLFANETRWVQFGEYRVTAAVFWHRNGRTAAEMAQGVIDMYDAPAHRKNPEIFSQV